MKQNKFIITVTDMYGSKQYSVHKIIKKILFGVLLTIILIGVITSIYIQFMHQKLDKFKTETQHFKKEMVVLKKEQMAFKEKNKQLSYNNRQLNRRIRENNQKLTSMNKQLREVEEMIGVGPDLNATFADRVTQARHYQEQQIQETLHDEKERITKDTKAKTISSIEKLLILNGIPNGKPLKYRRISSPFGYRTHPITKRKSFHAGIDLPAKQGTPIYAPASGVVSLAKKKGGYGNFLLLTHSYGFQTAYGHLSRFAVKRGEYVSKGDPIAYVGSTGRSTGPHLHYEIRYLTKWLDPKYFMFWNTQEIHSITKEMKKVNWKSIFQQTKKMVQLSSKKE